MIWRLKRGSDKKFRSRHPWVFSSELLQSPKGIEPGQLIELQDDRGGFLAFGYGHPNSMISFRTLSLNSHDKIDEAFFTRALIQAARTRVLAGVAQYSHRLCFAECDGLPGLIVDRYRLHDDLGQVFVVQASTAGMDRLQPLIFKALENLVASENKDKWEKTSIVVANDSKSRLSEGLQAEAKSLLKAGLGFKADAAQILIEPAVNQMPALVFDVDFLNGQKTGFFLDQRLNVHLAMRTFLELVKDAAKNRRSLRVLDLFCYVGQWGTQLAHIASAHGVEIEVVLVDASAKALELAATNVARHGGKAKAEKADVVDSLNRFAPDSFDVVICDPPAFVKKKKDLPAGSAAYFKVNREALRRVRPGGMFVSCSCSGLFDETEFRAMLSRVVTTARPVRWVARGSHSADHPQRPEFPQGTYLKSWMGIVDS